MSLFDKEEITAPSIEAAVAVALAPAAPLTNISGCTRDTRGEADCAVKNCENCN